MQGYLTRLSTVQIFTKISFFKFNILTFIYTLKLNKNFQNKIFSRKLDICISFKMIYNTIQIKLIF